MVIVSDTTLLSGEYKVRYGNINVVFMTLLVCEVLLIFI